MLSDHADWPELMTAIEAARAETVYVTHGFAPEVARWLRENGRNAVVIKTRFVGDATEMSEEESEPGGGTPIASENEEQ